MEETQGKGLWNLPLWLRRTAESKYAAAEALGGALERPFHEVVRVKPGFHCRLPIVRDTRAMEYLPRRSVDRKWNKSKREKFVLGCKVGRVEPLK